MGVGSSGDPKEGLSGTTSPVSTDYYSTGRNLDREGVAFPFVVDLSSIECRDISDLRDSLLETPKSRFTVTEFSFTVCEKDAGPRL